MLFPNSGGYCSEQALFSCGENSLMEPAANRRPAAVAQKRFPTSPGLAKDTFLYNCVLSRNVILIRHKFLWNRPWRCIGDPV